MPAEAEGRRRPSRASRFKTRSARSTKPVVHFSQISGANPPELRDVIDIYTEAFPPNERHSPEVIRHRLAHGRYRLIVGRVKDEIIFFALLWPLKGTKFVLLDYMATKGGYRGRGTGAAFLQEIQASPELAGKFLVLELESPASGENREQRLKRLEFYRQQGAKELQGVPYFMPGLAGGSPTEMILMILPEYDEGRIDARVVRKLIAQIYRELYDRHANDPLSNSFISGITGSIRLI